MATFKEIRVLNRVQPENAAHAAALARQRAQRDTKDETVTTQKELTQRIDLGLALLEVLRRPGQTLTKYDIAVWAGCTNSAIDMIENGALRKLANALRFGRHKGVFHELTGTVQNSRRLSRDEVRSIVAKHYGLPTKDEVRRALGTGKAA